MALAEAHDFGRALVMMVESCAVLVEGHGLSRARFVEGHGFSRAVKGNNFSRALAPVVSSNWKEASSERKNDGRRLVRQRRP